MKELLWKRLFMLLLGTLILTWGLYKLSCGVIIIGVIVIALALTLKYKRFIEICAKVLKGISGIDVVTDVAKEVADEVQETIPTVTEKEIKSIKTADSFKGITAATAQSFYEHSKKLCNNCGSSNLKQIEWTVHFDRVINQRGAFNKRAFKCDVCGQIYFRYDYS